MQDLDPNKLIAGRYRLRQSLGKGSFGEVFQADDVQFQPPRAVALKLLHPQYLADEQIREDLRREASILARFDHPNILRVIDFGISPAVAYIVTDLAVGGSLARKLRPDPTRPPVPMPLGQVDYYLEQIADALDDAHAQGLVHRDIKPQNILIDRRGRPMLADFGLAAAVNSTSSSVMIDTSTSGTPLYMAPEQWQGRAGRSSDIYALGAVVYQMITGTPPFVGNQYELLGQHLNSPVPSLAEKAPWLRYPPALDGLLTAAMAKDPHLRLKPAKELAFRFRQALAQTAPPPLTNSETEPIMPLVPRLDRLPGSSTLPDPPPLSQRTSPGISQPRAGQPDLRPGGPPPVNPTSVSSRTDPPSSSAPDLPRSVSASLPPVPPASSRPPGRRRRFGWLIGLLIIGLVLLVVSVVVVSGIFGRSDPTTQTGVASTVISSATDSPGPSATQAYTTGPATSPVATSAPATTAPVTTAPVTTVPPTPLPLGSGLAVLKGHTSYVLAVAFSPDSKTLASGSEDGTIKLWTMAGSKTTEKSSLTGHTGPVRAVAFSPDGQYLASGSADQTIKVWDIANGKEVLSLSGHGGPVVSVAFGPGGKTLASASDDKTVKLWNLTTGKSTATLSGHTNYVTSVAYSPDGKILASGSADSTIKLWDAATGSEIRTLAGHTDWVWSVAFSPDGKTVASGSFDHTIKLWDVNTGIKKFDLTAYQKGVREVAFTPDGNSLVSGSDDLTILIWNVNNRQLRATLSGHTKEIYTIAVAPDGKTLASGSLDNSVRLWSL